MENQLRRAKILSTIGPASGDPGPLREIVEAGSDAVRINFSHASHQEAAGVIEQVRDLARELGRPVGILADLQGPKIRVGALAEPLSVREGEIYRFVPEESVEEFSGGPAGSVIPTTFEQLAQAVASGNRILLDDGRVHFEVIDVDGVVLDARALEGGEVKSGKGINLPGVAIETEFLTAKDRSDLEFTGSKHVDYIGLSFVQRAIDLQVAREEIGGEALVIAKIEKDQALEQLEDIIRSSDGVMVARGDLGVELPFEDVPMVQKRIIGLGQDLARPVITATQMLESMIH
jgi:pyruvate kinase